MTTFATIEAILALVEHGSSLVGLLIAHGSQTGELNAEQVSILRGRFAALRSSPEARLDSQTPTSEGGTQEIGGQG